MEARKVPKSLFVLAAGGLLAFTALIMLVRMPRSEEASSSSEVDSVPMSSALTAGSTGSVRRNIAKKSVNENSDSNAICKSSSCLKTAYTILDSMNKTANPCHDFYEYACGGWNAKNKVPPSVGKWSLFGQLDFDTSKIIQEILREPARSGDHKALIMAKDFYKACSNVDTLNKIGLKPILKMLQSYGGWPILSEPGKWNSTDFDWMKSMADLKRMFGTSTIFDIVVNQHVSNTKFSTIHLQQPSLFLSRPYHVYPKFQKQKNAFKELIINLVKELKKSSAISTFPHFSSKLNQKYVEDMAQEIVDFETEIAKLSRDGVAIQYGLRNFTATLNLSYLQGIFDNYTTSETVNRLEVKRILDQVFKSSGIAITGSQLVSMSDTNFMGNIFELVGPTRKELLANYLHFRMLAWIVSGTTTQMRNHIHKFQSAIYGTTEPSSRDYVCASSTEEKFGLALTHPYLKKVKVGNDVLQHTSNLMEQVRVSFLSLLESAKWMNASVKSGLKRKARNIAACIGYAPWMSPDGTEYDLQTYNDQLDTQFKGLELGNGAYLDKLWNVRIWLTDQKLKILKERFVPGCKWNTFPGQIGAFYDIRRQTVNIPLGLLQAPFFHEGIPPTVNFGGLGSILGHEFTHGFTVHGWTELDYGKFSPIAQCLVDQYSRFKIPEEPNLYINGALTLDENFPDNGGLFEAFMAYKTFAPASQQKLPGLEELSQDQLFFLGFANIWCSSSRKEGLQDQVLQDHHTPNKYRVVGTLQNSQEFAYAWNCPLGTPMNPEKYKKCNAFNV